MSLENRLTDVVTVIGNDIKEVVGRLDGIVPEVITKLDVNGGTAAQLVNDSNYQLYLNFGSNAASDL